MNKFTGIAVLAAVLISAQAQANVTVGATRLIYNGDKKEASLSVTNSGKSPYLIQSWVETETSSGKAPFIITPPLFRLDGGQNNLLRVVRTGGNLPENRESLFWMNIKAIPSTSGKANQNTLQLAVNTKLKLIYRPSGLKGVPEDVAQSLKWSRSGNQLHVSNPTRFYMNLAKVQINGKDVSATYVAPESTADFTLPQGVTGGEVTWSVINDYGGAGKVWRTKI
ncbi:MAG TPA: molecular chaperone [Puia sp.]|jgi:P pilus assembly chaperone PapD|nr:molecular chaperone [Puia sp.]